MKKDGLLNCSRKCLNSQKCCDKMSCKFLLIIKVITIVVSFQYMKMAR